MSGGLTLYLVRHATAEERGLEWPDDSLRPLTAKGMAKFREASRGLVELGVALDDVLTSPLTRARQTAEILADVLPGHPPLTEMAVLAPGTLPRRIVEAVLEKQREGRIALVGHEPGIGELAAYLIGASQPLPFKKGAACCIEIGAGGPPGFLEWMATPKMLRALGGSRE